MTSIENGSLEFYSDRLITLIVENKIPRNSLSNHGEDFTGEGEELALRHLKKYLRSASSIINKNLTKGEDAWEKTIMPMLQE